MAPSATRRRTVVDVTSLVIARAGKQWSGRSGTLPSRSARRVTVSAEHEWDANRRKACRTLTSEPSVQPGKSPRGSHMGYFFAAVAAVIVIVIGAILRRTSGRPWRSRLPRRGRDNSELQFDVGQERLGRHDTYVHGQHHNPATHGGHYHVGGFGGHGGHGGHAGGGGHHGGGGGGHHG